MNAVLPLRRWFAPLANRASRLAIHALDLAAANDRWRETYNPLRGFDMARAVVLIEQMRRGDFAEPQWAFEQIERLHPTLLALVERRLAAIRALDWRIKLAPEEDWPSAGASQALAEDQAALLNDLYTQLRNLGEAIDALALAAFRGFALLQFEEFEGGIPRCLGPLDHWNVLRDGLRGAWYWNPEARSRGARYDKTGLTELPPESFLIRTVARPIDVVALPLFVRTNIGEKDWASFVEIFGVPGCVVIGPPNVGNDEAKETEFKTAAEKVAAGASGFLPNGSDAKFPVPPHQGAPFEAFLRYQQEQLVLAGTGGLLTMLTESGSGTLAGGAHSDAFRALAAAEAGRISEEFQRQLDLPVLRARFGSRPVLAYFDLAAREEASVDAVVDRVAKLAQAGYLAAPDEVAERVGLALERAPAPAPERAEPALQNRDVTGQPRADDGKWTDGGGASGLSRAERARASHKPASRDKQQYALRQEARVAQAVGGRNLDDNEPFDVVAGRHALEVKTIVEGKNPKVTMHPESLARKMREARRTGVTPHTVVVDARGRPPTYYYKRGLGSFRLSGMSPVSLRELKARLQ